MARTRFVSVNLTEPARDALQRAALSYSAMAGRRLSMSAVVMAALAVAQRHDADLASELTSSPVAGGVTDD